MRKIAVIIVSVCLLLCGCTKSEPPQITNKNTELLKGIWITYNELSSFSSSSQGFVLAFEEAVVKAKNIGINTFFVHTRAFCDAVYNSELFPFASYITSETDALKSMIDICHQNGIEFHAWINPYRVSTASNDVNTLPDTSPAKRWLTDDNKDNDKNVCFTDGGIYLNPAESECKKLVLDGVREILQNYDVDGIHIDDYFYPTTETQFDESSYLLYSQSLENPLTLDEWRRKNVSSLINSIYCTVKAHDKNIMFGVSPAADINRNHNTLFADVEGWLGGGYIDYIMPQLYFGFEYPDEQFCFENLLVKWLDITANKDIKLYCGLSSYKIGTDTSPDNLEWKTHEDILARQIKMLKNYNVSGYVFFSYTSLFRGEELNKKQLENILKE